MGYIEKIEEIVKCQYTFRNQLEGNEAQTRWMLVDPLLLDCLGYSRSDIIVEYNVDMQDRVNRYNKVDYTVLINNKPKLLIESKSLGINLYEKYKQLAEYFESVYDRGHYLQNELISILTNGDLYLFYTNSQQENKLDLKPFYTIQLSSSEDIERLKLLKYQKSTLLGTKSLDLITSEESYELYVSYRVDEIENVYNYFLSAGIEVTISNIHLKGRLINIKSLSGLYRHILKEVNYYKPDLLYFLANQEDIERNNSITSGKLSCNPINSTDKVIQTKHGVVYATIPTNKKGIIERILYLSGMSGYGHHNIMISLGKK